MGNLKCAVCGASEFHIERLEKGKYVLRCIKSNTRDHQRIINLHPDSLQDLR